LPSGGRSRSLWRRLRWRRGGSASARPLPEPAHIAAAGPPAARCGGCGRELELRSPPPGSMLQPVYLGVVCRLCGWIECKTCKGSPSDAPCTVCGSPVTPAYVDLFSGA